LSELPPRIERLEAEQARLHAAANGPAFYREPSEVIAATLARVHAVDQELLSALARWDDLDSRQKRS
jgi:ATP-binding cassette subfamily F protein uup